ncbi:MAG: hypothetical protein WBC91_12070 [Phototrophicaceae bacterium]
MKKLYMIQIASKMQWQPYHIILSVIVTILLSAGIVLTVLSVQDSSPLLIIPQPSQAIALDWYYATDDWYFRDSVFSSDGETHYILTSNSQLLVMSQGEILDIYHFADTITPGSLTIHPNGDELVIGAVERVGDEVYYQQGIILTIDTELLEITGKFAAPGSYNYGYSIEINYTTTGDEIYHLYNLNNAGCSRTSNTLRRWDTTTSTYERMDLPSPFVFDFAVTDDVIAVNFSAMCFSSTYNPNLVLIGNEGDMYHFPSEGTSGYRDLQTSYDQQMLMAYLNNVESPFHSTVHIWNVFDIVTEIEIDQRIQRIALSPDNSLIALTLVRDDGEDNSSLELHLYNRDLKLVTLSLELSSNIPIQQLLFSPDGTKLLLRSPDQIAVFELPPDFQLTSPVQLQHC